MSASFIDKNILNAFGLDEMDFEIHAFGSGLINSTWKLKGNQQSFILQQINHQVFKSPQTIADNLEKLHLYLLKTAPDYLFTAPLPALSGKFLVRNDDGDYFRLFRFVSGSHSVDVVSDPSQAYEAAKQFGKFSRLLTDFDPQELEVTIPDFHNLELRYAGFEDAYKNANPARKELALDQIKMIWENVEILKTYQKITQEKHIPLRVMHHDTKISNVLFDNAGKGLCVVDLDTVMPGYFLSDLGDMLRTYLSPVNEEEKDLSKIVIRTDYYHAIIQGYLSEMEPILTSAEKQCFFYAGKMMMYMQAIRFLTDFLNGDIYYPITYPDQNLFRAKNQLTLLNQFMLMEKQLSAN
ncbi:MAG: phosphotransferase enzyme family protein [Janthinobacterium lividum]